MEDKDFGFLNLSLTSKRSIQSVPVHEYVQEFVQSVLDQEQNPKFVTIYESFRFSQLYLREKIILDPTQLQEYNLSPAKEDMVSASSPLHTQSTKTQTNDFDLPIVERKGPREYKNRPFYPLSHHVSLKSFIPSHKFFLVSLNTVLVPNTLIEALSKSEWRNAIREEMNALEKNKTWEIVD